MIRTGRLARIFVPTAVLALASVAAQAQGNQSPRGLAATSPSSKRPPPRSARSEAG